MTTMDGSVRLSNDVLKLLKDNNNLDDALHNAAENGHADTVRVLLAHKADVHACGPDGKPDAALRWAAFYGHTDTVRVLLAHKADVHACSYDGKPDGALRWAAENGKTDTVRVLLAHKADVHACGSDRKPDFALYWAACYGHVDTVCVLLHVGAYVSRLPTSFADRHLTFSDSTQDIANLGLCLRFGKAVLRSIPTGSSGYSSSNVECTQSKFLSVMMHVSECYRDLCELVLMFV